MDYEALNPPEAQWIRSYLAPLQGCRVVNTLIKVDEDGVWPVIIVMAADGTRYELEVSRDEEGNGPGFLFGLPSPTPAVDLP